MVIDTLCPQIALNLIVLGLLLTQPQKLWLFWKEPLNNMGLIYLNNLLKLKLFFILVANSYTT